MSYRRIYIVVVLSEEAGDGFGQVGVKCLFSQSEKRRFTPSDSTPMLHTFRLPTLLQNRIWQWTNPT
jgi:hypothetical protein